MDQMSGNQQKRLKRRMRRAVRLTVAAAAVTAIFKLCLYAEEQRRDNRRRERRNSALVTLLLGISTLAGLFAALTSALAELKKKNGGYAIDLFDRDEYDIISPDEEDEFESIMQGELDGTNDDAAEPHASHGERVPVDDEATLDNF